MNQAPTSSSPADTDRQEPRVTLRYWAAARAAAGCAEDQLSGGSVAEVLLAARALRPDNSRFAQILGVSSLLLGDQPLGSSELSEVAVHPGDTIEVLPPFAGG